MKKFKAPDGEIYCDHNGYYDFGGKYAQTYKCKCKCGNIIEISTQDDSCTEYRADIYFKCMCGGSVYFSLPVN